MFRSGTHGVVFVVATAAATKQPQKLCEIIRTFQSSKGLFSFLFGLFFSLSCGKKYSSLCFFDGVLNFHRLFLFSSFPPIKYFVSFFFCFLSHHSLLGGRPRAFGFANSGWKILKLTEIKLTKYWSVVVGVKQSQNRKTTSNLSRRNFDFSPQNRKQKSICDPKSETQMIFDQNSKNIEIFR